LIDSRYTDKAMVNQINSSLKYFLENLSEKSIQIVENNVKIESENNKWIAKGDFVVIQDIGKKEQMN